MALYMPAKRQFLLPQNRLRTKIHVQNTLAGAHFWVPQARPQTKIHAQGAPKEAHKRAPRADSVQYSRWLAFLQLPYYRKLTLHEIKVLEINAT